jgi:Type IX secretion system protein PorV
MQIKNKFWIVLAAMVSGVGAQAQVPPTKVITTAVPSLRIPVDARATGMGNVGIATSADAASADWNVAKAPFASAVTGISAGYTPWEQNVTSGMYLLGLSGYHRLDTLQAVMASVRYFNMGDFGVKDMNGNVLQSVKPNELVASVGYARKLSSTLALGLAFKYIRSSLATIAPYKAGQGVAADVGVYYKKDGLALGLALSNLGSKIKYTNDTTQRDNLPTNLGIGGSYTVTADEENEIMFAAEVNKLLVPDAGDAWQYGGGVEYSYHKLLSLRVGYYEQTVAAGGQKGFTAGLGLQFSGVGVNLSYLAPTGGMGSQNPLKNTVRLGVVFGLGK